MKSKEEFTKRIVQRYNKYRGIELDETFIPIAHEVHDSVTTHIDDYIKLYEDVIKELQDLIDNDYPSETSCYVVHRIIKKYPMTFQQANALEMNCMLIWYYCDIKTPRSFMYPFVFDLADDKTRLQYRLNQMKKILQGLKSCL